MAAMMRLYSLPSLFICVGLSALPVHPPIERELIADDGRTLQARVVGVTESGLELVRSADQARFSLELNRLSEADRTFATELHARLLATQTLPDTKFLQTLRKDFLKASPDRKKLIPLAPTDYASAPRFLLALDPSYRGGYGGWGQKHLLKLEIDEFPVFWMLSAADKLQLALASETLPEGHAVLSFEAMAPALTQTRELMGKQIDEGYRRNPAKDGEVWYLFATVEEEMAFESKLLAKLPPYWPGFPQTTFNVRRRDQPFPYVVLVERDGRPTLFRGVPVSGSFATVAKVLREHASELQAGR